MTHPEWQRETQRRRRGHDFWPSGKALAEIPEVYATDGVPFENKMIYLHYWLGGWDWYVAEIDRETGEMFGYAINSRDPQGAEWGYTSLPWLEQLTASGKINDVEVPGMVLAERDLDFEPAKFSDVMADHAKRHGQAGEDEQPREDDPAPEPAPAQENQPAAPAGSEIVVEGRTYTVEKTDGTGTRLPGEPELPGYILHGKRGARYGTMRNARRPHQMFLISLTGASIRNIPQTWLTDQNGTLEVLG